MVGTASFSYYCGDHSVSHPAPCYDPHTMEDGTVVAVGASHHFHNNKVKQIALDIKSVTGAVVGTFSGDFVFTSSLAGYNPCLNSSNDENQKMELGGFGTGASGDDDKKILGSFNHVNIPIVGSFPKDLDKNLHVQQRRRIEEEVAERISNAEEEGDLELVSALQNHPCTNSLNNHCEHQKIYLEVDDIQLTEEVMGMHGNESALHVTANYRSKKNPKVAPTVKKTNTSSYSVSLKMPRTPPPGNQSSLSCGKKSAVDDKATKSNCYLGCVYESEGRWANISELCLHDIDTNDSSVGPANNNNAKWWDDFPTELTIEVSSNELVRKEQFSLAATLSQQPTSPSDNPALLDSSRGNSSSYRSESNAFSPGPSKPVKKIASNMSTTVSVKHHKICAGVLDMSCLLRGMARGTGSECSRKSKAKSNNNSKNKRPDDALRSGLYELMLVAVPPPAVKSMNKVRSALPGEDKPLIIGKIRIKLFIPDVMTTDIGNNSDNALIRSSTTTTMFADQSLISWNTVNNLDFVCCQNELDSSLPPEDPTTNSEVTDLSVMSSLSYFRLNSNRLYLIYALRLNMHESLPRWFQLTDLSFHNYMHISTHSRNAGRIRNLSGRAIEDADDSGVEHYFSTVEKDCQIVQLLYDSLSLQELILCLTCCGARILKWTNTMVSDLITKKFKYSLKTEKDWCSVRVINGYHYDRTDSTDINFAGYFHYDDYDGDEDEEDGDVIIASVIRRCISGLSGDRLCTFDTYCYVLALIKYEYSALTSIWSFFQSWLHSDFSLKLAECAATVEQRGDNGGLSVDISQLVEYLIQPDNRLSWVDCFHACWSLRLVILHEDIYGECPSFVESCTELAVEISHSLLVSGIHIFVALEQIIEKMKEAEESENNLCFHVKNVTSTNFNDDDYDPNAFDMKAHLKENSLIISDIIRSVSVLSDICFDSSRPNINYEHTMQVLAQFVEHMIYSVSYLSPSCWQQFVAFLSMLLRMQLLHSTEYTSVSDGRDTQREHDSDEGDFVVEEKRPGDAYEPTPLSDAIMTKRQLVGAIHPVFLSCIAAVGECLQYNLLLENVPGKVNVSGISNKRFSLNGNTKSYVDYNESVALELVAIADLLSESILCQIENARYKCLLSAIVMPLPPAVGSRRIRANVTNEMQLPNNLLGNMKFTTMPQYVVESSAPLVIDDNDYFNADVALGESSTTATVFINKSVALESESSLKFSSASSIAPPGVRRRGRPPPPPPSTQMVPVETNPTQLPVIISGNDPALINPYDSTSFHYAGGEGAVERTQRIQKEEEEATNSYELVPLKGATVLVYMKHIENYLYTFYDIMDAAMYVSGHIMSNNIILNNTGRSNNVSTVDHTDAAPSASIIFSKLKRINLVLLSKLVDCPYGGDDVGIQSIACSLSSLLCSAVVNSSDIDGECLLTSLLFLVDSLKRIVSVKSSFRVKQLLAGTWKRGGWAYQSNAKLPQNASRASRLLLNSHYTVLLETYIETFQRRMEVLVMGANYEEHVNLYENTRNSGDHHAIRNKKLVDLPPPMIDDDTMEVIRKTWRGLVAIIMELLTCYCTSIILHLEDTVLITQLQQPSKKHQSTNSVNDTLTPIEVLMKEVLNVFQAPLRLLNEMLYKLVIRSSSVYYSKYSQNHPSADTISACDAIQISIQELLHREFCSIAPMLIEELVVLAYSLPILRCTKLQIPGTESEFESLPGETIHNDNDKSVISSSIQVMRTALLSSSFFIMHLIMQPISSLQTDETASTALLKDDILIMKHINRLIVQSITVSMTQGPGMDDDPEGYELWNCLCEMCPSLKPLLLMGGVGSSISRQGSLNAGEHVPTVESVEALQSVEYMGLFIPMECAARMNNGKERAVSTLSVVVSSIDRTMNYLKRISLKTDHVSKKVKVGDEISIGPEVFSIDYMRGLKERVRRNMGVIRLYVSSISRTGAVSGGNVTNSKQACASAFNNLAVIASVQGALTKLWWQLPMEELEYRKNKVLYGGEGKEDKYYSFNSNQSQYTNNTAACATPGGVSTEEISLKHSVLNSLEELLSLSSNEVALKREVSSSVLASPGRDRTSSNSFDTKVTHSVLDSLGGVWLATQSVANLVMHKEFIQDHFYLDDMHMKIIKPHKNNKLDTSACNLDALVDMLQEFAKDNSDALVSFTNSVANTRTDPGSSRGGPFSTPFSPGGATYSASISRCNSNNLNATNPASPFLSMQSMTFGTGLSSINISNTGNKTIQYQKILQYYAVTLITELEKLHQLLRDTVTYVMKSGEWEVAYGILQELRGHYNNIVLPSFQANVSSTSSGESVKGSSASTSLFATPAMKHIKQAWQTRKATMLSEIDRTVDKLKDRLRHDEFNRPLPIVYAIRFLCSPWEDEEDEVEVVIPPTNGRRSNSSASGGNKTPKKKRNSIMYTKNSKMLDLTAFYEATNFEVIVINSEGKYVHAGSNQKSDSATDEDDDDDVVYSAAGMVDVDSLQDQVHQLQNNQQRRRSRETWLVLKYDILSHVYTSKVYAEIVRLQSDIDKGAKAVQMNAVNDLFGVGNKNGGGSVERERIPIELPENTYFHLVAELRKAFPGFNIHSSQYLVEDKYRTPTKVIQIFPAYPVLPNYIPTENPNDSDNYCDKIDDCAIKLGCEVRKTLDMNDICDDSDFDEDNAVGESTRRSLSRSSSQRFTQQAAGAAIASKSKSNKYETEASVAPGKSIKMVGGVAVELEISAWEMLSHCTDYFIYTYADPTSSTGVSMSVKDCMVKSSNKYAYLLENNKESTNSVLRIKLSTKCIKYAEAVEENHAHTRADDGHNKLLSRLNYCFAPSATASVEECSQIPIASAYMEVLSYSRLIVAHANGYLDTVKNMNQNDLLSEPMYDITSSRTLVSAAVSHLANVVGTPAISGIGIHNASTIVSI